MISKKNGQIPMVKTILIILITATILITFIINLSSMKNIYIDDKKINTQITINKILNSKCFSEEFATINKNQFTQDNLDKCFTGIDEEILLRVKIENEESLYLNGKKAKFIQKANFCKTNTNLLCTQMIYPIVYDNSIKKLTIQTII